MNRSLEQERELSHELLSEARAKREGYGSQAARRALSGSAAARCHHTERLADRRCRSADSGARRYGYCQHRLWKDVALGYAVTAGSQLRRNVPGYLDVERARGGPCTAKGRVFHATKLTVAASFLASPFHREAQNTRRGCKSRHMELSRGSRTERVFQTTTIWAEIFSPKQQGSKNK